MLMISPSRNGLWYGYIMIYEPTEPACRFQSYWIMWFSNKKCGMIIAMGGLTFFGVETTNELAAPKIFPRQGVSAKSLGGAVVAKWWLITLVNPET